MDYIRTDADGQLTLTQSTDFLIIPSCLYGFVNESTTTGMSASGRNVIRFCGSLQTGDEDLRCSSCRAKINNKIKTLRRQGYGYPDDEYFFLKLLDMSRKKYVRNPKSHKICD